MLLNWSSAFTVKVTDIPAVAAPTDVTTKCVAGPAFTVMAPLFQVMLLVVISLAVIV